VICVTEKITRSEKYRNALYMSLTRSFLQSFVIVSEKDNSDILPSIRQGLEGINRSGCIFTCPPTSFEEANIKTRIDSGNKSVSLQDLTEEYFEEFNVALNERKRYSKTIEAHFGEDAFLDRDAIKSFMLTIINHDRKKQSEK
jgi:hypothetical protein